MKTWKIKNCLTSHFNFFMADHHFEELKYRLLIFHMKIVGLKLEYNFPNDFCQAQLNFLIISLNSLEHFFDKLIFNIFWSQLIQKFCEDFKCFDSNIRFFVIQQLE